MRYKWLHKNNNSELIVFYNGWGLDDKVVKHLAVSNKDVLMFYDYNNLTTDFDFSYLKKYSKRTLIAWSMGVMIATLFNQTDYDKKIAINGTLEPISDTFGIPERIYNLTIKGFNKNSSNKFIQNMFLNEQKIPTITRDFENIKSELIAIKQYSANKNFKYTKVLISKFDKIIPTKNQVTYWNLQPNIESGHCPFLLYNSWEELI